MNGSLANIAALLGTILASGWMGSVLVEWLKGRSSRSTALSTAKLGREGQLDELTIDLIAAAKADMAEMRTELALLRPLQAHLLHFEEAIYHLEALVTSRGDPDVENAKNAARAFLRRIDRTRQALGNIRQEAQVLRSAAHIAEKEAAARAAAEEEGKKP